MVHPVPAPDSDVILMINSNNDGGSSQKLKLFIRGNDMSGALIIIGINQFPNPPIIIGITIKKIITSAWAVTIELKIWSSPIIVLVVLNSTRIIILRAAPIIEDHIPNIKYIVPIFLWFVENIQVFIRISSF